MKVYQFGCMMNLVIRTNMTLLNELHDIINEDDMTASHDLVEVMFNLLDTNQLTQLEDIITNQFPK